MDRSEFLYLIGLTKTLAGGIKAAPRIPHKSADNDAGGFAGAAPFVTDASADKDTGGFAGAHDDIDWRNFTDAPAEALALGWNELRARSQRFSRVSGITQTGYADVRVKTYAGGGPTPARIRAYANYEKSCDEYVIPLDGVINFIRSQTSADGECIMRLPVGIEYLLIIDKGIIYSTEYVPVRADPDMVSEVSATLTKLIDTRALCVYFGDLHHHSIFSGPRYGGTDDVSDSPRDVYLAMLAAGLDYGALCDHHNVLNHSAWRAIKGPDFTPVVSKEISTACGHISAHGVDADVRFELRRADIDTKPPPPDTGIGSAALSEDNRLRGEFLRVTAEIRERGGLAQLNHPCLPDAALAFPERFLDIVGAFDAMEIWNGHLPFAPGLPNEAAYRLWLRLLRRGFFLTATCGTDTHNIKADDYHSISVEIDEIADYVKNTVLPVELRSAAVLALAAKKALVPLFEEWAEQTFGTGGCVNMTFASGAPTELNILSALREGRNVITNGPLLLPSVNGKRPGETARLQGGYASVSIMLYSKKPLRTLIAVTKTGEQSWAAEARFGGSRHTCQSIEQFRSADARSPAPCFIDYSATLRVRVEKNDFVVVYADGGSANMAISNPIFLSRGPIDFNHNPNKD